MGRNASTQGHFDRDLVEDILSRIFDPARACVLVGISALQGSGKTTLTRQLVDAAGRRGIRALGLSLDDFYYGRRQRLQLAREVHPLLAVRSVPGTHDVALLENCLDALAHASARHPALLPRFDKGRDTRLPPSRWRRCASRPQLILLEGWCVGAAAQSRAALVEPINRLEREQDTDSHWRTHVNEQLAGGYARLWRRLDRLVLLQAPRYEVVRRWRDQQERPLRRRAAARAMSPVQVRHFLEYAERISRHALASLPAQADLILELGEHREVMACRVNSRPRALRDRSRTSADVA